MSRLNNLLAEREKLLNPTVSPIYYNPARQNRSHSLDIDALERSGIRRLLEQVRYKSKSIF